MFQLFFSLSDFTRNISANNPQESLGFFWSNYWLSISIDRPEISSLFAKMQKGEKKTKASSAESAMHSSAGRHKPTRVDEGRKILSMNYFRNKNEGTHRSGEGGGAAM